MSPPKRETDRGAQIATADYVASFTMELAQLCRGHGLDTLSYILEMARLEAENLTRPTNGRGSGS